MAVREAKDPNVARVYMNRGMHRVTKDTGTPLKFKQNRRPDVTVVQKDGKIRQIEVQSKTDDPGNLMARMDDTKRQLPERMQGKTGLLKYNKQTGTYIREQ